MKYRNIERFKYQLAEDIVFETFIGGYSFDGEYLAINPVGVLTIKYGYMWDGASGPTIDTPSAMFAALIHDALYELMRREVIPFEMRNTIDRIFHRLLISNHMDRVRANLWYDMVHAFAGESGIPGTETKDDIEEV